MSQREIASVLKTSETAVRNAIERHGIQKRKKSSIAAVRTRQDGYVACRCYQTGKGAYVHQLIAIAEGESPHKIFGDDTVVHHKNGYKYDNRPENLEVMGRREHTLHHVENGDITGAPKIPESELLSWLDAFYQEFGVVPTESDIVGWPGPSVTTYENRFGSFTNALEEAGYEPRGSE
jgi:hypothetical protein